MGKEENNEAVGGHGSPPDDKTPGTGPESPYTSSICQIYFKSRQPFTVHHTFIRKSSVLNSICTTSKEIHAEKLPDDAGHILIHFLYTGTYTALKDYEASTQFKTSVYVYAAARLLRLPALENLSKERVSHSAEALTPEKVITLAADVGGLLEKDDLWFHTFIKAYLRQLSQDPDPPNESTLLKSFHHSATYTNILIKGMLQICRENTAPVQSITSPTSSASSGTIATPPASSRESTCSTWPRPPSSSASDIEPKSATEESLKHEKIADDKAQALVMPDYSKVKEYINQEKLPEAIELLERVISIQKETLAETDRTRRDSEYELGKVYRKNNQIPESIALFEHLWDVEARILEETDDVRLVTEYNLGRVYLLDERLLSGIALLEHVVAVEKNLKGKPGYTCTPSLGYLKDAYERLGRRLCE